MVFAGGSTESTFASERVPDTLSSVEMLALLTSSETPDDLPVVGMTSYSRVGEPRDLSARVLLKRRVVLCAFNLTTEEPPVFGKELVSQEVSSCVEWALHVPEETPEDLPASVELTFLTPEEVSRDLPAREVLTSLVRTWTSVDLPATEVIEC